MLLADKGVRIARMVGDMSADPARVWANGEVGAARLVPCVAHCVFPIGGLAERIRLFFGVERRDGYDFTRKSGHEISLLVIHEREDASTSFRLPDFDQLVIDHLLQSLCLLPWTTHRFCSPVQGTPTNGESAPVPAVQRGASAQQRNPI